jgi:Ca2+-binding EF-hand superfamily protein
MGQRGVAGVVGLKRRSVRTAHNQSEMIMRAKLSKTFLAAGLYTLGLAAANAAPDAAPGSDTAPQAGCKHERGASGEHGRARFDARFKQLDTDSDGSVSKAEADKGAPHFAERFDEIDANKDGKLTLEEMRSAMHARMAQCKQDPDRCRAAMKERFEAAWKRADTDDDGMLSKAEAEQGMPRLARLFDQVDTDRDGRITLAEMDAARARQPHPRRMPKPDAAPPAKPQG